MNKVKRRAKKLCNQSSKATQSLKNDKDIIFFSNQLNLTLIIIKNS
jgi:hypothetical protein